MTSLEVVLIFAVMAVAVRAFQWRRNALFAEDALARTKRDLDWANLQIKDLHRKQSRAARDRMVGIIQENR